MTLVQLDRAVEIERLAALDTVDYEVARKEAADRLGNRDRIEKIAADPFNTFELWTRDVDKPFAFVAACIELASAWANPGGFETHLPIGFRWIMQRSSTSRDALPRSRRRRAGQLG